MLVLSYLGLLALVPLMTVSDSEYVRWHAKNGLVLTVGGWIALYIVGKLPFIWWVEYPGGLVLIILTVVSIFRALQGVRMRIPVVSDIAGKF